MPAVLTSLTHPLRIDAVAAPGGGVIGMTFCPGKKQLNSRTGGHWDRDLALDLEIIRNWGATTIVTLMEGHELADRAVADIGKSVHARGMTWLHLPIVDVSVPGARFEREWQDAGAELRAELRAGHKILLHCLGGLGRTGTIAARLLVELGAPPEQAIAQIRTARPGAIETPAQENHVRRALPAEHQ